MKCSAKCEVLSVWSVERECEVSSVKCGVLSVKCGVSVESGV